MQLERCSSPVAQRGSNAQCNAGGDLSSVPGSGRSPREGNGNPLHHSCLGNLIVREAWQGAVYGAGVQPRLIQGIRRRDGVGEGQETTA